MGVNEYEKLTNIATVLLLQANMTLSMLVNLFRHFGLCSCSQRLILNDLAFE